MDDDMYYYPFSKRERIFFASLAARSFAYSYIKFGWRSTTREYFVWAMNSNIDRNVFGLTEEERSEIIEKVMGNMPDDIFMADTEEK